MEERSRVPVRDEQAAVTHLIQAVEPPDFLRQRLDVSALAHRVDATGLLRGEGTHRQQRTVAGRINSVGVDRFSRKDDRDLRPAVMVEEVGRLHAVEQVVPVVAHEKRAALDRRVIGEAHTGQVELSSLAGFQIEDPHRVDVGDP
jgi:hypothetical protein